MRTRLFIIAYVVTLGSSALSAQVPTDKPSIFGSAMKKNLPPPLFGKTFDLASGTRVSVRTDDPAPWGTRLDDRGTSAKGSMIVVVLEFSEVAHILFEIRGEPHNSDVALEIDQVRINPLALATRMSGEYRFARLEAARDGGSLYFNSHTPSQPLYILFDVPKEQVASRKTLILNFIDQPKASLTLD